MTTEQKIRAFSKLYISGNYSNKQLAEQFGVSAQTICIWLKKSKLVKYHRLSKSLDKELEKLTSKNNYTANAAKISSILIDIERINRIINYLIGDYGARI